MRASRGGGAAPTREKQLFEDTPSLHGCRTEEIWRLWILLGREHGPDRLVPVGIGRPGSEICKGTNGDKARHRARRYGPRLPTTHGGGELSLEFPLEMPLIRWVRTELRVVLEHARDGGPPTLIPPGWTCAMPKRVLLIEDDEDFSPLVAMILTDETVEVITAMSGTDGLSRMRAAPPDLVILDLMLPGEDGLSICRRLRGAGDQTPIIMLTAKGEDVDRIVGLEMGADDYLPKPFNPRELVARVNAVLRRRQPEIGRAHV